MNRDCELGRHDDPDNTGQCVRCNAILSDPFDDEERAAIAERERREERARREAEKAEEAGA